MDKLNLGQHISQRFNEELEDVRSKVLQMGGIVEEQLGRAMQAMIEGDTRLAKQVVTDDYRVNALEVEIDEECSTIVARRQPAASDLRLALGGRNRAKLEGLRHQLAERWPTASDLPIVVADGRDQAAMAAMAAGK